ncbi:MAG: rod shape-determining protein MreC [Candidatus Parcubacteria bacterium]|nr:rod shape-determining protein MreC [Candidatus Parcubacteria bacterium]
MQTKKRKNKVRIAFFFFAFFVFVSFTAFPKTFTLFSGTVNNASVSVWNAKTSESSALSNSASFLNTKESLIAKNKELAEKIKKLEEESSGYDFIIQENLELKKTLSQKKEGSIFGSIIARPNITAYDTFLIDIGEKNGIKKGDTVLANKDMIIGTIEEAYSSSAKARLFSTAGQSSDALLGPNNIPIQLKGLGGGSFVADLPLETDVQIGDSASLSGSPEYIVATVVSKEQKSTDTFQKVYFRGPINIFDAKYIQVVKNAI